jgi:nitrogen fixation/metabolism regulation signal transduction histidine kinase
MFTKETGKQFLVVLAAVMVGLAVHQRFVAPRIKK